MFQSIYFHKKNKIKGKWVCNLIYTIKAILQLDFLFTKIWGCLFFSYAKIQ